MLSEIRKSFTTICKDAFSTFIQLQGDFAIQIEKILEKKGWSQKDLAEKSKINQVNISRLISGSANPTLKTIAQLQHALGEEIIIFPWIESRISELEHEEMYKAIERMHKMRMETRFCQESPNYKNVGTRMLEFKEESAYACF